MHAPADPNLQTLSLHPQPPGPSACTSPPDPSPLPTSRPSVCTCRHGGLEGQGMCFGCLVLDGDPLQSEDQTSRPNSQDSCLPAPHKVCSLCWHAGHLAWCWPHSALPLLCRTRLPCLAPVEGGGEDSRQQGLPPYRTWCPPQVSSLLSLLASPGRQRPVGFRSWQEGTGIAEPNAPAGLPGWLHFGHLLNWGGPSFCQVSPI